jgi:hypothetical protein
VALAAAPVTYREPVALAAIPTWGKIAIAVLAGLAIFVGVTVVVGAGLEAVLGAAAATSTAGTLLSGCIGGATSTAVMNRITGAAKSVKDDVAGVAFGCFAGSVTAALGKLLQTVATRIGAGLRNLAGLPPATYGGTVLEEVASGAAVDVSSPAIEMVTGAAEGAGRAAA